MKRSTDIRFADTPFTSKGVLADEASMQDRRSETRLLCAELVEVMWKDRSGGLQRVVANLEDISLSGACIQLDMPIFKGTVVTLRYGDGELTGAIKYCLYRDLAYFLGVQFAEGCRWSRKHFRPQHMLDPREMVLQAARRARARTQQEAS